MKQIFRFVLVTVLLCSVLPTTEAKKKGRKFPLPDDFPELTAIELSLKEAAAGSSAPAVVLFEAMQVRFEGFTLVRLHYYRRVKILRQDAVELYGDHKHDFVGDWRIKKIDARTVLPGGEVVDAGEGVFHEQSKGSYQIVRVAWPRVEVGAILDIHISATINYTDIPPWIFQGDLPILESSFVLIPPENLRYRVSGLNLPADAKLTPNSFKYGKSKAHVWTFRDIPALPDEPNQLVHSDLSRTLLIILQDYRDNYTGAYVALARDWESWNRLYSDWIENWTKEGSSATKKLAQQVANEQETPREKAEAIRQALADKIRVEYISDGRIHDSPDEMLSKGTATSGELARTAVVMLRAVGVDADVVAIRLRTSGSMPADFPIPALFDDMIVRMKSGKEELFFSPASDLPVGNLPWDRRGILGMPYDGVSVAPIEIPDFGPEDNRSMNIVNGSLDEAGTLSGTSTQTYSGVAAERWRNRLKNLNDEEQKDKIENRLQRWMPGLHATSVKIDNLEMPSKDLTVVTKWEVEQYGTMAGSRLMVNLNLFSRISAASWPDTPRQTDLDLGERFETYDRITVAVPPGVVKVDTPKDKNMGINGVGLYKSTCGWQGNKLVTTRQMRLARYWYPPESYAGLRQFFLDIATADDSPIVIQLK